MYGSHTNGETYLKKKKKSDNAVAHETQSSLDVLVIVGFFLKMNAVF